MRILRLEIEGFGPYLARQEIDFTAFEAEGLFAITGKTGAGKSTILDAICFALYDKVPRYDKAEPVLRSHFCGTEDTTAVTLDIEVGTEQYRVWRSPSYERAKARGTGTTVKQAEASLHVRRGGEWEILAAKPREVGEFLSSAVPLTGDQFLQVILLAQGRFAEFLRADTSERRVVLRSLFGTRRFEDLEVAVREVARSRSAAVEAADATLASLVERAAAVAEVEAPSAGGVEEFWATSRDDASRAVADAASARGVAAAAAEGAAAALNEAREVERARERLSRAAATVASLNEEADAQSMREARVAQARRAAPAVAPMREASRAAQVLSEARLGLDSLLADSGEDAAPVTELRERESDLTARLGELKGALAAEASLPSLEAALEAATLRVTAAVGDVDAARTALEALPTQEAALRASLDAASLAAARVADLAAAVERAEASVTAHAEVAGLESALADARTVEAQAAGAHADASSAHHALVERRLRSQAAHLASALVEGEACPVCGGLDHPSPAAPSDDHVTDEAVDAAYEAVQQADAVLRGAREARIEADRALAAARERAGTGDAETAATALETAKAEHAAATAAANERERLTAALTALESREKELTSQVEARATALESARTAETEARAALATALELATQRPDGYDSVGDYAAALSSERTVVGRLIAATEAVEAAMAADAKASAAWEEALASSGLADREAVTAAALEASELSALEAVAETYRSDLAAARAVVAELSERPLPEEAADLEALDLAAREAAAARDTAIEASTAAAGRLAALEDLASQYEALGASTAAARAERDVVLTLADSLEGKAPNERRLRLESFVLASKLEKIVTAANLRLTTMSSGQYRLEHDDSAQYRGKETGLALRIADAHTGQSRSTRSLSGGETFLASLSLALGLAETVTAEAGGIQLSTLFIDEGFGSLDGDTLEVAMSTLNDLRDSGRTVGLISHVEAMHDAIPAQLEVVKAADGSSRVAVRSGVLG